MNAWAVLRACCSARERAVLAWFYAGFALLGVVIAATLPTPDPKLPVMLMGLPTLLVWGGWFARLLLLQRQARNALMPGLGSAVASALALAAMATIVSPALAAAALGLAWLPVLVAFTALASAAVLAMLLPRGMMALVAFVPMALNVTDGWKVVSFGDDPLLLPALAAVMCAICAWRWRAVLRGGAGRGGDWSQPFVIAIGERGSWLRTSAWSDPDAQQAAVPRWMQPGRWSAGVGPAQPVRAMRAWLGSPFAPLSPVQRMAQVAGWGVLAVFAWYWSASGRHPPGPEVLVPFVLLVGGAMVVVGPVYRLQAFKQAANGEMAELALLPGWGDAVAARRLLVAAIARPLAPLLLLVAIVALGIGLWLHEDALRFAIVLVALLAIATAAAAGCLRALSGDPLEALGRWSCFLAACLMFILTTMAFGDRAPVGAMLVALGGWGLLAAGCGLALHGAWRRWHAQSHGFLASAH